MSQYFAWHWWVGMKKVQIQWFLCKIQNFLRSSYRRKNETVQQRTNAFSSRRFEVQLRFHVRKKPQNEVQQNSPYLWNSNKNYHFSWSSKTLSLLNRHAERFTTRNLHFLYVKSSSERFKVGEKSIFLFRSVYTVFCKPFEKFYKRRRFGLGI